MDERGERDDIATLRYACGMLAQLTGMLPLPRRSLLVFLLAMAQAEIEREIASRAGASPQREGNPAA